MNIIPHLYLHSVAPQKEPQWCYSFLTVEQEYFESLLRHLLKNKYVFITLDEYFHFLHDKRFQSTKFICLSFDDGYLDNYVYVYPLLKKHGIKATVFVNPEFVQTNSVCRPTMEDVWDGNADISDLESFGFASWTELKEMQDSGYFDVQSHTLTHTKYFISDKIIDFHNPKAKYLYPISNIFPERKPYYITDNEFIGLIPFGTPLFEERSAVIARRVFINDDFQKECADRLKNTDWKKYNLNECMENVKDLHGHYRESNTLISEVEDEKAYQARVRNELRLSKKIIEKQLNKPVLHCCWPHGDHNDYCHEVAIEEGYMSSTIALKPGESLTDENRIVRSGYAPVFGSKTLSLLKADYKIKSFKGELPYSLIQNVYYRVKYKV